MKSTPIPANEVQRLADLYRYDILDTEVEAEFDDFARLAAKICGVPMAAISVVDKERVWFKSGIGFEVKQSARDASLCSHTILGKEVFEIEDATQSDDFVDHPVVTSGLAIRFYAGSPLLSKGGSAIGSLCVFDFQPKRLTSEQIELLEALSRQIMRQLDLRLLVHRHDELSAEMIRQRNFQKLLFDSAMAGVVSTNLNGEITGVNRAFEKLVGYAAGELIHHGNIQMFHLNDELETRAIELSIQLGRTVEPADSIWTSPVMGLPEMRDWTYRCKDGSQITVLVSISPLPGEDGVATGFVVMVWDITERTKMREQIVRLNAELEEQVVRRTAELERKTSDLQLLSHSLAHDLRQPLITISGCNHRLRNLVLSGDGRRYLDRIELALDALSVRTDSLLYFINLSRHKVQRVAVDLSQLASEQLSRLRRNQPQRRLRALIPPELSVWADSVLMPEAISEMILNAWKLTADRDQSLIEIGSEIGEQGETIYFVKDNGAGFDMTFVDSLFEPFQYIETVPGSAGHGIGLAKVKRIVVKHGGRVWAESRINEGSVFYFTLPDI